MYVVRICVDRLAKKKYENQVREMNAWMRSLASAILFIGLVGSMTLPALTFASVFSETFDGGHSPQNPGPPVSFTPSDWDIQVHVRSAYEKLGTLQAHEADHGPNCEAPGHDGSITHTVDDIDEAVYHCANHVMTSLRADDYGLIALTPPSLVDFSSGEATIRFDLSTLSVSGRDWFGIVIQPWNDQLPLPISSSLPDLNGFGRSAIVIDLNSGAMCPKVYREFQVTEGKNKFAGTCQWWKSLEDVITPSAQTRQTIQVTISKNRVRVEMPEVGLVWDDMAIADLDWNQGVVSFLHHSYTPFKGGHGGPNTWHLDNVEINPARPFTVIPAQKRWVNEDQSVLTFPRKAPEGAYLRGTAIGTKVEISFDDGLTWQQTRQQPSQKNGKPTWQFWHPVPVGTKEISIRTGAKHSTWWSSKWIAKGMSLFALTTEAGPILPPSPPTPNEVDCRKVIGIQQRIGDEWTTLNSTTTSYTASDCLQESP